MRAYPARSPVSTGGVGAESTANARPPAAMIAAASTSASVRPRGAAGIPSPPPRRRDLPGAGASGLLVLTGDRNKGGELGQEGIGDVRVELRPAPGRDDVAGFPAASPPCTRAARSARRTRRPAPSAARRVGIASPARPSGYPPPSQRSWWSRAISLARSRKPAAAAGRARPARSPRRRAGHASS